MYKRQDPEFGRRGERLQADTNEQEIEQPTVVRISPCGNSAAEVDQDRDGDVDWCRATVNISAASGCPALLIERDGRCIANARPPGAFDPLATTTTTVDPDAPAEGEDGETPDGPAREVGDPDGDAADPSEEPAEPAPELIEIPADTDPATTPDPEPAENAAPAEDTAPAPTAPAANPEADDAT